MRGWGLRAWGLGPSGSSAAGPAAGTLDRGRTVIGWGCTMASGQTAAAVTLAAVQVRSRPGQPAANWKHAAAFIEQAAAQGAGLVVLPELFSCGYVANRAIWDMAEAREGGTAR